jgi:hypothetical protein
VHWQCHRERLVACVLLQEYIDAGGSNCYISHVSGGHEAGWRSVKSSVIPEGIVLKRGIVSTVLATAAALFSLAGPAQAAVGGSGWKLTYFSLANGTMGINALAASSSGNAWALGFGSSPAGSIEFGLLNRWNGKSWRPVKVSKSVADVIVGGPIGTSSPSNVWAYGAAGQYASWNGRKWVVGYLPAGWHKYDGIVNATAVVSKDEVWALGDVAPRAGLIRPYAAEKAKRGWRLSRLPASVADSSTAITDVSAVSGTDIWALLTDYSAPSRSCLLHWNGRAWSLLRLSAAVTAAGKPFTLVALSPSSVWIDESQQSPETGNVLWHWNGHQWTSLAGPTGVDFGADTYADGMAADNHGGIWVLSGGAGALTVPLGAWDYRAGQWAEASPISSVNGLSFSGLVSVPHSASLWAYGDWGAPASTTTDGLVAGYRT